MTAWGQWHALPHRSIAVRFTPVSGINSRSQALPSRAKRRPEQVQQHWVQKLGLLDHLVGDAEQRRRHSEAEHPGRLGVDD
jgi:hypothetical protein